MDRLQGQLRHSWSQLSSRIADLPASGADVPLAALTPDRTPPPPSPPPGATEAEAAPADQPLPELDVRGKQVVSDSDHAVFMAFLGLYLVESSLLVLILRCLAHWTMHFMILRRQQIRGPLVWLAGSTAAALALQWLLSAPGAGVFIDLLAASALPPLWVLLVLNAGVALVQFLQLCFVHVALAAARVSPAPVVLRPAAGPSFRVGYDPQRDVLAAPSEQDGSIRAALAGF